MKARCQKGFTLIELLIVVVIIGILASIAIPKFNAVREKGFRASMMSDLRNLANLQELYHNDYFTYSTSLDDVGSTTSDAVTLTVNEATGTGWAATAIHAGVLGEQCGVYHGNADPGGGDPATAPGMITCTF